MATTKKTAASGNVVLTKDLVEAIAAKNPDITKTAVKTVLTDFIALATKSLKKGDKLRINGLGTFTKSHRAARKARNPATGEQVKVKASKSVRFKPSTTLKSAM